MIVHLAELGQADGAAGLDPLRAIAIFVGFPALITAVVIVAVYAGRWKSSLREGRKGVTRSRPRELPPLTEPVLGTPGRPVRRRSRQAAAEEADPDRPDPVEEPNGHPPDGRKDEREP